MDACNRDNIAVKCDKKNAFIVNQRHRRSVEEEFSMAIQLTLSFSIE